MKSNASARARAWERSSVPAASAARSRSAVEALATPALIPAQRARSMMGISPPVSVLGTDIGVTPSPGRAAASR